MLQINSLHVKSSLKSWRLDSRRRPSLIIKPNFSSLSNRRRAPNTSATLNVSPFRCPNSAMTARWIAFFVVLGSTSSVRCTYCDLRPYTSLFGWLSWLRVNVTQHASFQTPISSPPYRPPSSPSLHLIGSTCTTTIPIKHLTPMKMASRSEKGPCFNCDAKFILGHQCSPQFMCLMIKVKS